MNVKGIISGLVFLVVLLQLTACELYIGGAYHGQTAIDNHHFNSAKDGTKLARADKF